jgi:hypothetical protein
MRRRLSLRKFVLVVSAALVGLMWSNRSVRCDFKPIIALCETLNEESTHNNSMSAAGHPWNLDDLLLDASIRYDIENLHDSTRMQARVILAGALMARRSDETLGQLCKEVGHPISNQNGLENETVGYLKMAITRALSMPYI